MTRTYHSQTTVVANEHELDGHRNSDGSKYTIPSHSELHYRSSLRRPLVHGEKQPTGWTTVSYHRPQPVRSKDEQHAYEMRKQEELSKMDDIMNDPVKRWKYERRQDIYTTAQRLMRDQRFYGWTARQVRAYVDGYKNRSGEPTVLLNPKANDRSPTTVTETRGGKRRAGSRRDAALEYRAEAGDFSQKEFSREFVDQVKRARSSRKTVDTEGVEHVMTQQDLANLLNANVSVIHDFESYTLPFDGGLKSKLIWKLGLSTD
jgi:hypothetical protein